MVQITISTTDKDTSEEDDNRRAKCSLGISTLCFIANVVVYTNTNKSDFEWLGWRHCYLLHIFLLWTSVSVVTIILITFWVGGIASLSNNQGCYRLLRVLIGCCLVAGLATFILNYVQIGKIWHSDPYHSIFFYRDFWCDPFICTAEGRISHPNICSGQSPILNNTHFESPTFSNWPYIVSTVVIRIHGLGLMILPVIVAILVSCGGCAFVCGKCFS
jgi:hypothetical protein